MGCSGWAGVIGVEGWDGWDGCIGAASGLAGCAAVAVADWGAAIGVKRVTEGPGADPANGWGEGEAF